MEPELWKAIQILFDKVNKAFNNIQPEYHSHGKEDLDNSFEHMDIVNVRSEIRKQFENLRIKLLEYLSEQECYQVIFPLMVHFDEKVRSEFLMEKQLQWPLLQKEFYDVDNGGELFYDNLNSIFRKPQTSEFIFEVNYFCLKNGFRGKYVDEPIKIKKYKDKLKKKISVMDMDGISIFPEDTGEIRYFSSPLWYYGLGAAFLAAFYGVLKFIV